MKLGLLADIHEQTKQLRRAIAVLQQHGAERFVVLGDVFEMGKRMEETGFLTWEYQMPCRKLVAALARKRPSPLTRGKPELWACAVLRVIGWVNLLSKVRLLTEPRTLLQTAKGRFFYPYGSSFHGKAEKRRQQE